MSAWGRQGGREGRKEGEIVQIYRPEMARADEPV